MDADILIIGSGAGGGTLARGLADSGLKILVLERGDYLPREYENWDAQAVFEEHRYLTTERWRDSAGHLFQPVTNYHVGGNTKIYGAAVLRRRESDFGERKHEAGKTASWPINYNDLAAHYDQAEKWYFAHGAAGVDPTDPPRRAYPFPPLHNEPRIEEIADHLKRIGLHPFSLPLAIHRDDIEPTHAPCVRCDTCDGFPCLVHAKGDAQCCGIAPALQYPNVRLLTNTYVKKILTSPNGTEVRAVWVEHNGQGAELTAQVYVLAAGAVNSAAILLRSASDMYPNGMANQSDLVGRHYMCHLSSVVVGIDPRRPNPTVFQKTLGINDFYEDSGLPDFPYPLGHIQNLGKITPSILHAERPYLPWSLCHWMAHHSVDWWLTTEDLADPENRVTIDADGGIRLHYRPNNEVAHKRLVAQWKGILRTLKFPIVLTQRMQIDAVGHQTGTLRFGTDPAHSVLNSDCRAHSLTNLYAVDASFMPSISAVNPSLTVMANALRVADILRARFA